MNANPCRHQRRAHEARTPDPVGNRQRTVDIKENQIHEAATYPVEAPSDALDARRAYLERTPDV